MLYMGVEEIKRLSQDEGLIDKEIATVLGIHRVTVTRIRKQYDIPKAVLSNRKDKISHCTKCGKTFIIRRKERIRVCDECTVVVSENID